MASNCQTKKSGMETIEYKKLKENMSTVTDTIEVVLTAKESLITKFKESAWMSTTVKSASASSLVSLALNRIKIDVNDHLKFVDMLRGITGMDQIVAILNVPQQLSMESAEGPTASRLYTSNADKAQWLTGGAPVYPRARANSLKQKSEADSGMVDPGTPCNEQPSVSMGASEIENNVLTSSKDCDNSMHHTDSTLGGSNPEIEKYNQLQSVPVLECADPTENRSVVAPNFTHSRPENMEEGTDGTEENLEVETENSTPPVDASPQPMFSIGEERDEFEEPERFPISESSTNDVEKTTLHYSSESAAVFVTLKDYIDKKDAEIKALQCEVEQIKGEKELTEQEKKAIKDEKDLLENEFTQYKNNAEEREKEKDQQLESIQAELENCKERLAKNEQENEEKIRDLEKKIETIQKEKDEMALQNKVKMLELEVKIQRKKKETAKKEREIEKQRAKIAELEKKLSEIAREEEKKASQDKLRQMEEMMKSEKDEMRKLKEENKSLTKQLSEMKLDPVDNHYN